MLLRRTGRYLCLVTVAWVHATWDSAWSQHVDPIQGGEAAAVPVEVRVLSLPPGEKAGELPTAVQQLICQVDPSQLLVEGGLAMGADQAAQESEATNSSTVCLRLAEPEFAAFVRQVVDQNSTAIDFAPKLLLEMGQEGTVSDRSGRPFVTGFYRVEGNLATAYQPVVKSFFEGTKVSVRLDSDEPDVLRVAAHFERSRINHVDELELEGNAQGKVSREVASEYTGTPASANNLSSNAVTVQIPHLTVLSKSVHASLRLDETLVVAIGEWEQPRRVEKGVPIPGGDRLFKRVVLENQARYLILAISPRKPSERIPSDQP